MESRQTITLADFEAMARHAMEPAAYDYIAGGAWDEQTLTDNVDAWRRRRLRPRVLVDVSHVDPSTTMLGAPVPLPLAIAPMAAHRLAHADGELVTARAAATAGIPFTLSTMSSQSLEVVADAVPEGVRWFQLYTQADPGRTRELVQRAAAAGYAAIVLTVDLPVLGFRERDRRNAFDLAGPHGNFVDVPGGATHGAGLHATADAFETIERSLERGLTWEHLEDIRSWSDLPLVLKGILTAEDAQIAVDHDVAGIVVSNHGARQLDRVSSTADALEEVVAAVSGRTEVWVDGGIRRGLDIVTAIALGARGVLLGRPILWALAADGEAGIERAIAILTEETRIAMALLGAPTIGDLHRGHVG